MKKAFFFFIAIACSLTAIVSCTKKSQNNLDNLPGKWKMYQVATDTNNNGYADSKEFVNVDTSNIYYLFYSNGTLVKNYHTYNDSFVWVAISPTDLNISNIKNTNIIHIDALSSTYLILKDTQISVNGYVKWYIFNKSSSL